MYNNNITAAADIRKTTATAATIYIIYILHNSNAVQNFAGTACVSCNTLFQSRVIKNALFEGKKISALHVYGVRVIYHRIYT